MPLSDTTHPPQSRNETTAAHPAVIDWIALALMIIGSINWGLVGVFQFDLVAALFGDMTPAARAVYALVGLAGIWGLVIAARWARR